MRQSFFGRLAPGPARIPLPVNWRDQPRSAAGIFNAIMSLFAGADGKHIWCEKTPMHVHHIAMLAREFPNAKFLHIIRDGRDCAASFHRRWGYNPVRTIYRWKQAVVDGRAQGQSIGRRYFEVRYEEVTLKPEESFQDICAFLGVPFERTVLKAARARPHMTGSNSQSIVPNQRSAAKYFALKDLERIERVAGRCLADLGYSTDNRAGDENPRASTLRWWELADDTRRFVKLIVTERPMLKPGRWAYILRRTGGAIKQRISLR